MNVDPENTMLVTVERQGFAVLLKIFCGQCWSKVAVMIVK
ncbi:hypothetical protein LTSEMIN_2786 [Salmonella enterica subsp. enterica serovar Minnesota str. A4-603]|uniref:Uncharacterized protein n=1 Tax=Salmonella enterica subsp. enterica serovar Rubislaw str. A4-653 TaxID=913081 RepID=G5QJ22_SALRU|nr:hypothetical protein LTSEMIN_2786 [Salmonella enterica subsp. enterica serovar Minnesota str. A4-603]EHC88851.1 hypothetical protein LTSERUB_2599 [Salmonella enterica subsp. enterica serovar Rubislaw str. A4-653]